MPEEDLDTNHDTLRHLRDEGLVATVDLGGDERGLTLTKEGRDLRLASAYIYVVASRGGGGRSRPHPRMMEEFL